MKVCIPINENEGLNSQVCGHFGSAPAFLITDTESGSCEVISNNNSHHAHGMCQPLQALAGASPDAVIVGGIGMGALLKLNAAGIRVFLATATTVTENLVALKNGGLAEARPETACGHHGHGGSAAHGGGGCGHGRGHGSSHG
jgi:predicted Fe-Mo cluster-binding NifX family protein